MKSPVRRAREKRAAYQTATRSTQKKGRSTPSQFKRISHREIRAVVQKIVDALNPEKVILFGSYAYGKPTTDSDVDVLIVVESAELPAQRIIRTLQAIRPVKTFPMDVLVRTPSEVAGRLAMGDFFIREITERGKSFIHDELAEWIDKAEEDYGAASDLARKR